MARTADPSTAAFMARLWSDQTMWRPKGVGKPDNDRAWGV